MLPFLLDIVFSGNDLRSAIGCILYIAEVA